jgi:hypothetical protein
MLNGAFFLFSPTLRSTDWNSAAPYGSDRRAPYAARSSSTPMLARGVLSRAVHAVRRPAFVSLAPNEASTRRRARIGAERRFQW